MDGEADSSWINHTPLLGSPEALSGAERNGIGEWGEEEEKFKIIEGLVAL